MQKLSSRRIRTRHGKEKILNVWVWGVVRGIFGFVDFDGEAGTGVGSPFFGGGEDDAEDECGFLRVG